MTGVFPGDGTDDFIALNPYDIFEDVTVYAIDVAIEAGSENGTPVVAHLFDGSDDNYLAEQYGGLIASTFDSGTKDWGCQGTTIGTSNALGTGQQNTSTITTTTKVGFPGQ